METKACTTCGETKELIEFSKRRELKSGFHSRCKACSNAYRREYAKTKSYIHSRTKSLLNYEKNNPDKLKARSAVHNAVARGALKKTACIARECGSEKVHAHHYLGYKPEHWLDILWLCQKHHARTHYIHEK